jgi:hypothetical protein
MVFDQADPGGVIVISQSGSGLNSTFSRTGTSRRVV